MGPPARGPPSFSVVLKPTACTERDKYSLTAFLVSELHLWRLGDGPQREGGEWLDGSATGEMERVAEGWARCRDVARDGWAWGQSGWSQGCLKEWARTEALRDGDAMADRHQFCKKRFWAPYHLVAASDSLIPQLCCASAGKPQPRKPHVRSSFL